MKAEILKINTNGAAMSEKRKIRMRKLEKAKIVFTEWFKNRRAERK